MVGLAKHLHVSARLLLASLLAISSASAASLAEPLGEVDLKGDLAPNESLNPEESALSHGEIDAPLADLFLSRNRTIIAQQTSPARSEVLQLSVSRDATQPLESPDSIASDSSSSGSPVHSLQLSTTSTQLQDSDDILSQLVSDLPQSVSTQTTFHPQPTLVATVQGLMPLYLRSVRNVEQERLGVRSVRSAVGDNSDSINQFLQQFSNRYHCNVAWQSPVQRPTVGVEVDHHLAIQRTQFGETSVCQPLRPTQRISLLTRLTFLPLELGEFARLDWGTVNYQVLKDDDDNITGSIGISPSVVIQPVSGLSVELEHDLKFQGDSDSQEHWFAAAHIHQTGAIISIHLPEIVGNELSVSAESTYDWVNEVWKPSEFTVAWDMSPLGVRWEANTKYMPVAMELRPIELSFQHELPWNIRWGFRTHYHQEEGEIDPFDFTFDHDLPLMEWLTANRDEASSIPLGLRYGVQTQQVDRDTVEYAVGVGIEIGEQETGQWDFRLDWDGVNIESLSTSYDREDWRMLVRVEPDPDDYSVEGRITLFSGK
ncbi:MAG: hypothetical protein AAGE92_09870 [Cyanobacteria bacterium P01_G01_bin.4]